MGGIKVQMKNACNYTVSPALQSLLPHVLGDLKWGEFWVGMESLGSIFTFPARGKDLSVASGKGMIGLEDRETMLGMRR